jgi:creatinine amidohydrolase/Fe(II)-dependent formamide hydrolase-like protein
MMDYGDKAKNYAVYQYQGSIGAEMDHLRESEVPEAHAGELETSLGLHLFPEHVRMEALPENPGTPAPRPEVDSYTPVEWVTMYPDAYAGDAQFATAEKGQLLFDAAVRRLAACIRAVKADDQTLSQMRQFTKDKQDPQ